MRSSSKNTPGEHDRSYRSNPTRAYPYDPRRLKDRSTLRREVAQLDTAWHDLARRYDASLGPDGCSKPIVAELQAEQDSLVWRDVHWLRVTQLPIFAYMWHRQNGFCFELCEGHDADATLVIEGYQRLWKCLEQEAGSALPRGYQYKDCDELEVALRPFLLKHRLAQMAATNDLYGRLCSSTLRWLDAPTLAWLLDDAASPLGSLEQKTCLIAEVQRFRDASNNAAHLGEFKLEKMAREWFRGVFLLRSGHLHAAYDFVDEWLESLQDMQDNRGDLRMTAAMWLHERQTNGRFKIPNPLLAMH